MVKAAGAVLRKIWRQICRQIFRANANPSLPVPVCPRGQLSGAVAGMSRMPPEREEVIEDLVGQILDHLSSESRSLGSAVIARLRDLVGDLPASANHHHSEFYGLLQHSLEVGLKVLEELGKTLIAGAQPGTTMDTFHTSTISPQGQYLCFLAGLGHDLGKLFDIDVQAGECRWSPLHETYAQFLRQVKTEPVLRWKVERVRGGHAQVSPWLMHHLLTPADIAFIGLKRLPQLTTALTGTHKDGQAMSWAKLLRKVDQANVEEAAPDWMNKRPDSKANFFIDALRSLIQNGELRVNSPGAPVYVTGDKAAVVVPISILVTREFLRRDNIKLPSNHRLYDLLAQAKLVAADEDRQCVRRIKVPGKHGPVELSALIFDQDTLVPKRIIPTLPKVRVEISRNDPKAQSMRGRRSRWGRPPS